LFEKQKLKCSNSDELPSTSPTTRNGVVGSAIIISINPAIGVPVQRGTGGMDGHHT
jgi:hypothetical protein